MCIVHTLRSADLIAALEAVGWRIVRVKGSHHQLKHPGRAEVITVPHPKKDLGTGLVARIRAIARLK